MLLPFACLNSIFLKFYEDWVSLWSIIRVRSNPQAGQVKMKISVHLLRSPWPNTYAQANRTSWGFRQFSRRIFRWQSMTVLLLLAKIAWTNLIKLCKLSKIATENLENILLQIWTILESNYTVHCVWDPTKIGQWALYVYSIANFVASWLKWLQMISNDSKWVWMCLKNQLKSFEFI